MKNTNSTLIWTLMAFARYEAFELLDNYNKVLYLDTDVLIQKDIIELLNINKDISVSHEETNLRGNIENKLFAEKFDSNKYNLDTKVFNSGVFLINDSIKRRKEIKEWCYKMSAEWRMNDQPILNLMVQEFNLEVNDFSDKYNRYYFSNDSHNEDAYILHTLWDNKFWKGVFDKEWNENNKKWIELGGIPYDPEYVEKKMKEINKIAWWIPSKKLKNIYRVRQAEKFGFRWHLY
ncbi:glycosyltransferase [Brachyspira intermedia]|uniref:glycosyltransferase n=1 Tax=Brachyspira intermedia TaxID=84377 RepID=UPI003006E9E8